MTDLYDALGKRVIQRLKAAQAINDMEPGAWFVAPQKGTEYFWIRDAAGDELAEVGHVVDATYIADWSPDTVVRLLEAEMELIYEHREVEFGFCNTCYSAIFPCSLIRNRAEAWGIKEAGE